MYYDVMCMYIILHIYIYIIYIRIYIYLYLYLYVQYGHLTTCDPTSLPSQRTNKPRVRALLRIRPSPALPSRTPMPQLKNCIQLQKVDPCQERNMEKPCYKPTSKAMVSWCFFESWHIMTLIFQCDVLQRECDLPKTHKNTIDSHSFQSFQFLQPALGVWVSNTWAINWAHTLARLDWGCQPCKHAASQGAMTKICAPCTVELCRVLLGLGFLSRVKVAASLYVPLWSLQGIRHPFALRSPLKSSRHPASLCFTFPFEVFKNFDVQ